MPAKIDFTLEIAKAITDRLASGESLKAICSDAAMPSRATVVRWLSSNADFEAQCARARAEGVEVHMDRLQEIVEEVLAGTITPEQGRVAINSMQWTIMKRAPKYADRPVSSPVTINANSDNRRIDVTLEVLKLAPAEVLQALKEKILAAPAPEKLVQLE